MSFKIFVIGLDGATFDIILPLVENGKLPTFQKLMSEGSWGYLKSTIPYLTPPAWTSSLTGVNPGKHNIFDFFKRTSPTEDRRVVNSSDKKCPAIWSILSKIGKTVGVFNVPITYPPEEVNGFMISGMGTPGTATDYIYPQALKLELETQEPELKNGPKCLRIDYTFLKNGNEKGFLDNLYEITDRQEKLLTYLYQKYKTDFFMFVFDDLDRLQHFFWRYMDKTHFLYEENSPKYLKYAIYDYYKYLDKILSKIITMLDDDTTVIIYSDHGFGSLEKEIYINQFLKNKGFLKTQFVIDLKIEIKRLLNKFLKNKYYIWEDDLKFRIDWNKTSAYFDSLSGQNIKICLKENDNSEYEALRDRLIKELNSLRDPETGEKIIKKVHKREDIYHGPFVVNAPDLIVECKEKYCLQLGFNRKMIDVAKQYGIIRSGDHRPEGVVIFWGKNIKNNYKISKINITDIMPTMLHILGLKIPSYVDGRVVEEIFSPDFIKNNPVEFTDADYEGWFGQTRDYSPEEEKEITERLKGLGYL